MSNYTKAKIGNEWVTLYWVGNRGMTRLYWVAVPTKTLRFGTRVERECGSPIWRVV